MVDLSANWYVTDLVQKVVVTPAQYEYDFYSRNS